MATQVLMPKLGFSMDQGTVAEWFISDGSVATVRQPLYSLESDKSVQEIEAPASGRLKIIAPAGESYPVGHVLAEID